MKPLSPHDPRNEQFDDLIAAALHGDLTPEERAQFEARLSNDPAAQAAYQEAQAMNDLLEKTHKNAQPDPAFEQRMVSGVRRKIQHEEHRETAWESLVFFWKWVRGRFSSKWTVWEYSAVSSLGVVVLAFSFALYHDARIIRSLGEDGIANSSPNPEGRLFFPPSLYADALGMKKAQESASRQEEQARKEFTLAGANTYTGGAAVTAGTMAVNSGGTAAYLEPDTTTTPQGGTIRGSAFIPPAASPAGTGGLATVSNGLTTASAAMPAADAAPSVVEAPTAPPPASTADASAPIAATSSTFASASPVANGVADAPVNSPVDKSLDVLQQETEKARQFADSDRVSRLPAGISQRKDADGSKTSTSATDAAVVVDTRKLIRNAQLDLEVKSFQAAMDQITALTKAAGGYVDTSNSQKGGNGKLQGTVVVKVLPQNLDAFLLKLRDLGQLDNQSVSTDDVTKDYFDTQARLDNSRRMETQLQDLLKHANSKVSDLLQVERELGRVRGEIEQMQGQLKLYDFQVQYATVTMQMREKDLNQTAAYLLREQDEFSLFSTDVEGTFQKARQSVDNFKAQVLVANLVHNSGSDVSAELVVMVAPDQIEPFLAEVRSLGRVANFTRQTQRVAKDGGNSDNPADQTLTEKDKVQVHLAIRSDDETRKQVALTVVAKAVDDALDQAKTSALANAGVEILNSSLNKSAQGQSTAQLTVRVPGQNYLALITAFKALGRTDTLSIQRNDNSGPGANGDDAPVIVSLALTDDDAPLQETEMSVLGADVDSEAQQIKKDAAAAGVEVKASSFERQPDGTELAQMTFRLPMSKYPTFVESVKTLGRVETLSVRRDDRPDQTRTDETAPVEITLHLHNQGDIVAEDRGLWATLRQTFGDGAGALFTSVRTIGVLVAFIAPWVVMVILFAWIGRRIYIWRKK